MRIYLSCLQSQVDHSISAYKFWEIYFKNGLEEGGHEWIETHGIDWAECLTLKTDEAIAQWKGYTWSKVFEDIKKRHQHKPIDFFLSYFYPKHIDKQAIKQIQSLGIPCVNFFCDNVREFTKIPDEYSCFDLHWVPEYKAIQMYTQVRFPHIHLPMPMWVDPKFREPEEEERYGVTFIGSRDIQRHLLFSEVIEKGLELQIRGAGWEKEATTPVKEVIPFNKKLRSIVMNQIAFMREENLSSFIRKTIQNVHKPVVNPIASKYLLGKPNFCEYIDITRQSIVVLGVNRYSSWRFPLNNPNTYSRLRDIEAPMVGACYLTEWTDGLEYLYDLGTEIETYRTPDELYEKVKYLEQNPEKRKMLRHRGQKRALQAHSVPSSVNVICKELFGTIISKNRNG